jgi:ferredoxin-NADP reductase
MTIFRAKLIARKQVAKDTVAFIFEKPSNFNYKAGQYASFMMLEPLSATEKARTHFFSLASDPHVNELMIATRMGSSVFKKALKDLPLGSEVEIKGPMGEFTLHTDPKKPAVYLTGGVGITPIRSILRYATTEKLSHPHFLFYSNRSPETSIFLPELILLTRENPHFQFIATMTHMENSVQEWPGETGKINREMIEKYVGDLKLPIYYISGPLALIKAMKKILNDAGVADDQIRTEIFPGY